MASLLIDDQDAAVYSVGQVAGMLQMTQAFLRRLDELPVVCPDRSSGGQRRASGLPPLRGAQGGSDQGRRPDRSSGPARGNQ